MPQVVMCLRLSIQPILKEGCKLPKCFAATYRLQPPALLFWCCHKARIFFRPEQQVTSRCDFNYIPRSKYQSLLVHSGWEGIWGGFLFFHLGADHIGNAVCESPVHTSQSMKQFCEPKCPRHWLAEHFMEHSHHGILQSNVREQFTLWEMNYKFPSHQTAYEFCALLLLVLFERLQINIYSVFTTMQVFLDCSSHKI